MLFAFVRVFCLVGFVLSFCLRLFAQQSTRRLDNWHLLSCILHTVSEKTVAVAEL